MYLPAWYRIDQGEKLFGELGRKRLLRAAGGSCLVALRTKSRLRSSDVHGIFRELPRIWDLLENDSK